MISNAILLAAMVGLNPAATAPTPAETAAAEAAPPSSEPVAAAAPAADAVRLATEADVKVGATVNSKDGLAIGTVVSVDSTGAVIDGGKVKAKVSLSGLGVNSKGLLIGMTKAEFESATATTAKAS